MAWCVETLKVVGRGMVQKSSLCSFQFHLGHYENFIIMDEKFGEVIKVVTFPNGLFEQEFYGKESDLYTMHFMKFVQDSPIWITDKDCVQIAEKYKKQTGSNLKLIERISEIQTSHSR